jgi:hypothetical protein
MEFKLVEWSEQLDLTEFYNEAAARGFVNNSSQKAMIDCFKNEGEFKAWILYHGDKAVGSGAAHSFNDVMGSNTYRIGARTCTFAEARPAHIGTLNQVVSQHQTLTAQFFIPKHIEWVANRGNVYVTSHDSSAASHRKVHRTYFPALAKIGTLTYIRDVMYRGSMQSVWQLHPDVFLDQLSKSKRW